MEQKTNPSGQQAAPEKGNQREWLQEVINHVNPLAQALDQVKDTKRCIITVAIENEDAAIITAGGSYPLAVAVKQILTGSAFAGHVANACQLMAAEAAEHGDGAVVIHVKPEAATGTEDKEAKTDED